MNRKRFPILLGAAHEESEGLTFVTSCFCVSSSPLSLYCRECLSRVASMTPCVLSALSVGVYVRVLPRRRNSGDALLFIFARVCVSLSALPPSPPHVARRTACERVNQQAMRIIEEKE